MGRRKGSQAPTEILELNKMPKIPRYHDGNGRKPSSIQTSNRLSCSRILISSTGSTFKKIHLLSGVFLLIKLINKINKN